jgi:hypothetical protein
MTVLNIHLNVSRKQDSREGIFTMQGIALQRLVHNLIREYGVAAYNTFSVDFRDLSLSDKRIFLSYVTDSEEYSDACENETRLVECIAEHEKVMQELLDEECFTVYCEEMEEAGRILCRHPNNDEVIFSIRY